jgi:lipoic acid synthetase
MILGDTCTRACGFCNVKTGKPPVTDYDEPARVAESLRGLGLKFVVITSVDRDDLPDGGASIWAETIRRVKDACPDMKLEVLIGDFKGDPDALQQVIDAKPDVIAHNLETVRRCHPAVRPSARYERTMELLRRVKAGGAVAKTGIMVGIGERDDEVIELFDDLVAMTGDHDGPRDPRDPAHGGTGRGDPCDIITIGQYLQPTRNHLPLDRWVHPDRFAQYETMGKAAGIKVVFSGPLVRSSYLADKQFDGLSLPAATDGSSRDRRVPQPPGDELDAKIVHRLVREIEAKDASTAAHTWRVVLYLRAMLEERGVRGDELLLATHAAALHDVGKLDIPAEILQKPGRLTPEEFEVIEQHTVTGYARMIELDVEEDTILDLVRYHHEKMDGSGYPFHLTEAEIPQIARDFAVIDTFDALTSHRPYRNEVGHDAGDKAIAMLIEAKGPKYHGESLICSTTSTARASSTTSSTTSTTGPNCPATAASTMRNSRGRSGSERSIAEPGGSLSYSPAIFLSAAASFGGTSIALSRLCFTSANSANRSSALMSASVASFVAAFTGARSTSTRLGSPFAVVPGCSGSG